MLTTPASNTGKRVIDGPAAARPPRFPQQPGRRGPAVQRLPLGTGLIGAVGREARRLATAIDR
jgi:hypothetical protein